MSGTKSLGTGLTYIFTDQVVVRSVEIASLPVDADVISFGKDFISFGKDFVS